VYHTTVCRHKYSGRRKLGNSTCTDLESIHIYMLSHIFHDTMSKQYSSKNVLYCPIHRFLESIRSLNDDDLQVFAEEHSGVSLLHTVNIIYGDGNIGG
jgi:hypothetical protein